MTYVISGMFVGLLYMTFSLPKFAFGGKLDLLPKKEEYTNVTDNTTKENSLSSIIAMPRDFPSSYSNCDLPNHRWLAIGRDAKMIKAIANKLGIFDCVSYYRFKPGYEFNLKPFQRVVTTTSDPSYKITYPHAKSDLCIIVKRNPPVTFSLANSFTLPMWIATIVSLLSFGVALHLLGVRPSYLQVIETFIVGSFLEKNIRPMAVCLLLCLSVAGLIITTAFSGAFTSFLSTTVETHQPETLEEINARINKFYISEVFLQNYVNVDENDIMRKLLEKKEIIRNHSIHFAYYMLDLVSNTSDIGILISTSSMDFMLPDIKNKEFFFVEGRLPYHIVKECPSSPIYIAYEVKRSWALADKFSMMMMRLVDSGIPDKLHRDSRFDWWEQKVLSTMLKPEEVAKKYVKTVNRLQTRDIYESIIFLLCGLATATFAFLCELINSSRFRKPRVNPQRRPLGQEWVKRF